MFVHLWLQVAVNTPLTDLHDYLAHLLKSTNMKSLTPEKALSGECGFMAANLYAKSIFGEDALANVSLEKNMAKPESPVTGTLAWLIGCLAIGLEITV